MSREILTLLTNITSIPKFQSLENELKLQQILILLLSKSTISLDKISFAHSLINVLMSLENTKYRILWLKTTSALVQIMLLITNDIRDEPT